ncbi:hypothetical protein SDC9_79111 [bioreactor metagenome]|uniref:Uncharacterized protein n=1 Tax=bioreactor metagenome TaxID=1076179 RepID=A0A644YW08_9ZZZZ
MFASGHTATQAVNKRFHATVLITLDLFSEKVGPMKQTTLNRSTLMLGALLALTACGGGGGGTDPTTPPVTPPVEPPAPGPTTRQLVQQFIDKNQAVIATALPAQGADRFADLDACYLSQGRTKEFQIANWNANQAQIQISDAYTVGRTYSNVQIVDERKTTNADGSARHEVDITYNMKFTDGTTATGQVETLIAGSSSGSCAAPQTGTEMRVFGNRRIVNVALNSRNRADVYFNLSDGTAATNPLTLRREMQFIVADPGKIATYAVVSWASPQAGATAPFTLKLISPRIARDAPEMQDARGSGTYGDSNSFRLCRSTVNNDQANAATADCTSTTLGIASEVWGATVRRNFDDPASLADGDTRFAALGLAKDTEVTFDIYADEGWKTVNGQQGKTPIATYKVKIRNVPYNFAQLAISNYPQFPTVDPTTAEIAAKLKSTGGTVTAALSAGKPPAGGLAVALGSVSSFRQGPKTESASGRYQIRDGKSAAVAPNAKSIAIPFDGKPDGASATSYGEFSVSYPDRNGRELYYTMQFN